MNTLSSNIALLFVVTGSIAVLFCYFLYILYRFYVAGKIFEKKTLQDKTYQKALSLVQKAQTQSLKVVIDSHKKAQRILGKAQLLDNEQRKEFLDRLGVLTNEQIAQLNKLSSELRTKYTQAFDAEAQESIKAVQNVSKDIETQALKSIDALKKSIENQTLNSQKAVDEKVALEYESLKHELEVYKSERLKLIDNQIYNILFKITKDLIGKSIDLESQKELVLNALEEAKIKELFTNETTQH